MPLGLSAVVLVEIQSIASRKSMVHPCLTPDCTGTHLVRVLPEGHHFVKLYEGLIEMYEVDV